MSIEELKAGQDNWTLQQDVLLCKFLDDFQKNLRSKCTEVEKKCEALSLNADQLENNIQNLSLQLSLITNKKFVDTRILDDDIPIRKQNQHASKVPEKSREEATADALRAIKEATQSGLQLVNREEFKKPRYDDLPSFIGTPEFFASKITREPDIVVPENDVPEISVPEAAHIVAPISTMPPPPVPIIPSFVDKTIDYGSVTEVSSINSLDFENRNAASFGPMESTRIEKKNSRQEIVEEQIPKVDEEDLTEPTLESELEKPITPASAFAEELKAKLLKKTVAQVDDVRDDEEVKDVKPVPNAPPSRSNVNESSIPKTEKRTVVLPVVIPSSSSIPNSQENDAKNVVPRVPVVIAESNKVSTVTEEPKNASISTKPKAEPIKTNVISKLTNEPSKASNSSKATVEPSKASVSVKATAESSKVSMPSQSTTEPIKASVPPKRAPVKSSLFDFDSDEDDLFSEYAKVLTSVKSIDKISTTKPLMAERKPISKVEISATKEAKKPDLADSLSSTSSLASSKDSDFFKSLKISDDVLATNISVSDDSDKNANRKSSMTIVPEKPDVQKQATQPAISVTEKVENDGEAEPENEPLNMISEKVDNAEEFTEEKKNTSSAKESSFESLRKNLEKMPMLNPSSKPTTPNLQQPHSETESDSSPLLVSVTKTRVKGPARKPPSRIMKSESPVVSLNTSTADESSISVQTDTSKPDKSDPLDTPIVINDPVIEAETEKIKEQTQKRVLAETPSEIVEKDNIVPVKDATSSELPKTNSNFPVMNNPAAKKLETPKPLFSRSIFDSDSDDDVSMFSSSSASKQSGQQYNDQPPDKVTETSTFNASTISKSSSGTSGTTGNQSKHSIGNPKKSIFDFDSDDDDMSLFKKK